MAHQIRNPCAIILANANLVLKNQKLSSEARQSLEAIVHGVRYLEARLDEFVEFSKPLLLKTKEVPVEQLCHDICDIVKDKCLLQKTKISYNVDVGLALPKADQQQMLLALLNIVINAIESIKIGGSINLTAKRFGDKILIIVQDTGCGIHPRDLPEIFSPFYSTKEGGIGIGLAVSRKIIEAHGGSAEVSSHQDKGTYVTVSLPA